MRLLHLCAAVAAGAGIATAGSAIASSSSAPDKLGGAAITASGVRAHTAGAPKYAFGHVVNVPPAQSGVPGIAYATAKCPRGTHASGGGWNSADTSSDLITVTSSVASAHLGGWVVAFHDLTSSDSSNGFLVQAFVLCV